MRYRRLGNTGLQLSELSLGTWATVGDTLGTGDSQRLVESAYDEGVNFFDTAEVYSNGEAEAILGSILKAAGWPREAYVICTKIMWGTGLNKPNTTGLSRKHLIEGCHASMKRLQLDHLDLMLCHRADPNTRIEETVRAVGHLLQKGDILYWGTSEWSTTSIIEACQIADELGIMRPVVEQSRYNLFYRKRVESELLNCMAGSLGLCAWSPLSYGVLAGTYDKEQSRIRRSDMLWLKDDLLGDDNASSKLSLASALEGVAKEIGLSPAVLALAWNLGNENVSTVLTGASNVKHLVDNLRSVNNISDLKQTRKWIDDALSHLGFEFDLDKDIVIERSN